MSKKSYEVSVKSLCLGRTLLTDSFHESRKVITHITLLSILVIGYAMPKMFFFYFSSKINE